MIDYLQDPDIANSFWVIGDDTSRVWSVADRQYVTEWPSDAFLLGTDSEFSLTNFLRTHRIPGPVMADPTTEERIEAAETLINLILSEGE